MRTGYRMPGSLAWYGTWLYPPCLQAGSVYGVSVFADEYGKWGTALQGMALQETVNRKQTKYFP